MSTELYDIGRYLWMLGILFLAISLTLFVDRGRLRLYEHGAVWRIFFMFPWDQFVLLNSVGRWFYIAGVLCVLVGFVMFVS